MIDSEEIENIILNDIVDNIKKHFDLYWNHVDDYAFFTDDYQNSYKLMLGTEIVRDCNVIIYFMNYEMTIKEAPGFHYSDPDMMEKIINYIRSKSE